MNDEYKVYQGVTLGSEPTIGPWVILGAPPKGYTDGELTLKVGNNAHVRSHSVIYAGSKIGNNFATGHGALVRERVTIGDNVSIGSSTEVEKNCAIGNNVRIHSNCFIAEGTVIEDNVKIAPGTHVASDKHPLLSEVKKKRKGPHIGRGVYVGIGATLLPGIKIGEGSFVGAGAVVTKDVPARVVVLGNPAKVYMSVEEYMARLV